MASTCCARWIDIGGTQVELNGVDDLLQKLYFDGWLPGDAGLDDALLKGDALPPEGRLQLSPTGAQTAGRAALHMFHQHQQAELASPEDLGVVVQKEHLLHGCPPPAPPT